MRQAIHICGTHDVAMVGNVLHGGSAFWGDPSRRSTPFWKPHTATLDRMLVTCTTGGYRILNNVMTAPISGSATPDCDFAGNVVVSNRADLAAVRRAASFVPVDTARLGTNSLGQAFERRDGRPYRWRQL